MNIRTWRLVKRNYAKTAFSGEGAAQVGGRWNSPGVRIVYTAETLSLAVLEILAGGAPMKMLDAFVKFAVVFDDTVIAGPERLPQNRKTYPPGPATQSIGDSWVKKGSGLVLKVPSAVVPGEFNFLINPAHPDFARKISIGTTQAFKMDPRLFKQG